MKTIILILVLLNLALLLVNCEPNSDDEPLCEEAGGFCWTSEECCSGPCDHGWSGPGGTCR